MGRRGNKEGTIFKRQSGLWVAQVSIQGRRLTMYGKSRQEVSNKLKEALKQVDQGLTLHGA